MRRYECRGHFRLLSENDAIYFLLLETFKKDMNRQCDPFTYQGNNFITQSANFSVPDL